MRTIDIIVIFFQCMMIKVFWKINFTENSIRDRMKKFIEREEEMR
ncbi:Hypothetical protein ACI5QM_01081 [Bacillus subtilis]|uniref:Uncharacterized protein n=1 Tax=Bacillus subtilis subsp. subtilis TaxID=135461 RepID=A0ABD3ZZI6_BACIU|nr:hypothetical protein B4067_1030 [Bacillus subtilis subsp. subtilis]BAI84581.1 hypothetical protein BSNT_07468 [Bacillus subtilis subsp. natto BEST195]GAK79859.1 hypothetical protein BSMD_017670 [Bacillus subtilis Miyagi-4]